MVMKVVAFLKTGWHEVPHLMFGGALILTSAVMGIIGVRRSIKYDMDRRWWKKRYTVVREEDFDPNKQVYRPTQIMPYF